MQFLQFYNANKDNLIYKNGKLRVEATKNYLKILQRPGRFLVENRSRIGHKNIRSIAIHY